MTMNELRGSENKLLNLYKSVSQFLYISDVNLKLYRGPGWLNELDYLTSHTSLSPIRRGFAPGFVNYKKECTRLAAANDKVYQLLADGPLRVLLASSTTKTGRHDIAEILLQMALNTKNQSILFSLFSSFN